VFGNAIMALCCFPFQKNLEVLPNLTKKKKQTCLINFGKMCFVTTSFDLCISKGAHDVFALVINFFRKD
jgi:hypothetical protein